MRKAQIERKTNETDVWVYLELDGQSGIDVRTGFGFADHMLELLAHWGGFGLEIRCTGDMQVDAHHSLEDIGLCLGRALREALGDKKGIARTGRAAVPMDEALSEVCVDISGRPYLVFNGVELLPSLVAGEERHLWPEFFKAFVSTAKINLHINIYYGQNGHHMLESVFKGCGQALISACRLFGTQVLSTKGSLD
ncbi:MAG: imidazoleglycerol-phosphate dehydratase HisB [Desulfonatronovibrionaceae bacterium]